MTKTSWSAARMVEACADYIVFKQGNYIKAKNCSNGAIKFVSTDAQTVIQAAIDALPDGVGGKIFISTGTYTINDTIELYRNYASTTPIWLCGAGISQTQLQLGNSIDKDVISFDVSGAEGDGWKTVSDLYINGNKANNASGNGVIAKTTGAGTQYDMILSNLFIYECKDNGIDISNGWGDHLHQIITEYNDGIGLKIGSSQCYVNQMFSAYNGSHGLEVPGGGSCYSNINLRDNGGHGLIISQDKNLFTNILIEDWGSALTATYHGILIEASATDCMFSSVSIYGGGDDFSKYGLYMDGSRNHFNSLTIRNTGGASIVDGGTDNQIDGYWDGTIGGWGTRFTVHNLAEETADAEEPQGTYREGTIVKFTDSGDASGDGFYILDFARGWNKLA